MLDDPANFRTKEVSKLGVLEDILLPERHPELYGDIHHQVRINYYPPRGDDKEGWDNIDLFGWMGYPMQIKIDFLQGLDPGCSDSAGSGASARPGRSSWRNRRPGLARVLLQEPSRARGRSESDLFAQERRLHRQLASLATA